MSEKENLREIFNSLLSSNMSNQTSTTFKNLISFVDQTLSEAYGLSGDDRAKYLVRSFLNIRSFMESLIITENSRILILQEIENKLDDRYKKEAEEILSTEDVPAEKDPDAKKKLELHLQEGTLDQ